MSPDGFTKDRVRIDIHHLGRVTNPDHQIRWHLTYLPTGVCAQGTAPYSDRMQRLDTLYRELRDLVVASRGDGPPL